MLKILFLHFGPVWLICFHNKVVVKRLLSCPAQFVELLQGSPHLVGKGHASLQPTFKITLGLFNPTTLPVELHIARIFLAKLLVLRVA